MKLSDVAGSVTVSPQQAVLHLTSWFMPDDLVVVVGIRQKRGTRKNVIAQVAKASELVAELQSSNGDVLLDGLTMDDDGVQWNVYIAVSAAEHQLASISKRGGLDNIASMPGVWVDLDIKPGSFSSQDEILQFMREKLPEPSLVIATGSGGVHGYWRTAPPLNLMQAREVQRRWWSHVAEAAGDHAIDKLVDPSRILRLAGTIRWPKEGEDATPAMTHILHVNREIRYSLEQLYNLTSEAWHRYETKINRTRVDDAQRRLAADEMAKLAMGDGKWATYAAIGMVEELYSELVSWDDILEPNGWTFLREDSQGRREWARPGRGDKSATTDWPESPDVMSLLSWSDDTGLADLREAGLPLSKYRVGLRLMFDDDQTEMIKWVLANRRQD